MEPWKTEVCFLHIQLIGTNVRLPKIHWTLPEVDFESSRSPAQSESWENSQSTVPCCLSHMTMLSVITRVMNAGDQTSQVFVTSPGPFCDCSGQCVHGPKNVWSTNSRPNVDISGNFESNFWQLFHRFQLFLFEVMVVNAWCTESFYSPVRTIVSRISFAWPSMSWDQEIVFACDVSQPGTIFSCSGGDSWFEHWSVLI